MGIPGQFGNQRFLDALAQVVETSRKYGLAAGIQPGSPEQAQQWMGMGYNMISYSADHAVYRAAVIQGAEVVRKIAAG